MAVPEVFEQMIPHALTPSERGTADIYIVIRAPQRVVGLMVARTRPYSQTCKTYVALCWVVFGRCGPLRRALALVGPRLSCGAFLGLLWGVAARCGALRRIVALRGVAARLGLWRLWGDSAVIALLKTSALRLWRVAHFGPVRFCLWV